MVNPPTAHSTPVTDFTSKKIPCTLSIPHNKEYEIVKKKQKTSARNSLFTTYHPQTTPSFYDLHVNFTIYRPPPILTHPIRDSFPKLYLVDHPHIPHVISCYIPYTLPQYPQYQHLTNPLLPTYHLPSSVHIYIPTSLHPRIRLP